MRKKFSSFICTLALLFNSLFPLFSQNIVYGQEATPSALVSETLTPTSTQTPTPTILPIAPFEASLSAVPTPSESSASIPSLLPSETWVLLEDRSYQTVEDVVVGKEYQAPQNDKVKVVFNKLPFPSGKVTIKEVKLTLDQIQATRALSETAYDITSSMANGTFEYTLTLPAPKTENVEVKSSEDGQTFVTLGGVTAQTDTLTITGLNHFTLFLVTTVTDFNNGVSEGTTVNDVGEGDGSVLNSLGSETLDQSQTSGSTKRAFDNTNWLAQTFAADQSGLLTRVTVRLDRNNSSNTNGDVTMEIRSTENGIPGSTTLASSSLSASSINKNGATNYDFTFSSPPSVTSGNVYAILIYRSGSGTITTDFNWYSDTNSNNSYAEGNRYKSTNSGADWNLQNSGAGDLRFKSYYQAYITTGTQTSDVLDTETTSTKYSQLSWNETLLPGTDIIFEARASESTFLKSDVLPSWISFGLANSPIDLSSFFPNTYRYFQWRATFTGTATSSATLHDVSVVYNNPPSFDPIADQVIEENSSAQDVMITNVSAGTNEVDQTVTFSAVSSDSSIIPDPAITGSGSTRTLTYTPNADSSGTVAITVTADDGQTQNNTFSRTFMVTVNPIPRAIISGYKFEDKDGDGVWDDDEDPLFDWTITLNGATSDEIQTDEDGYFEFTDLLPGTYYICENQEDSWIQTSPTEGFECENGTSGYGVELSSGDNLDNLNFGNFRKVIISSLKWEDLDADGIKDESEPVMGGWNITLSKAATTVTDDLAFASLRVLPTDDDGQVSFEVDQPGTYRLTEESKDNFQRTYPVDSFFDIFVEVSGQTTTGQASITEDKDGNPLRFGNTPYQQLDGARFVPTSGSSSSTTSIIVLGDSVIEASASGGTSTVSLPGGTVITKTDGGEIDLGLLSAQDVSGSSLSGLGSGVVVDGALQWGIPNLGLEFSNPITLSIYVGTALNGQTLNVVRSSSTSSGWTSEGIVAPATCVVSDGLCTFQATKASYYATTRTVSTTTTSTSTSGGGDGGSGGGAVSAPSCDDSKPGSAPTLISASSTGPNQVTLTWSKALDPVTYYLVSYRTAGGQQYGNPNVGGAGTTSYTVTNLSGSETYYFKVRAGNGCMPGAFSEEKSVVPSGGEIIGPAAGFQQNVLGVNSEEEVTPSAETASVTPPLTTAPTGEVKGIASTATNYWWLLFFGAGGLALIYWFLHRRPS